ncbi:hypothetical protein [Bradyrhizobium sp. URHD0069]|uniref:hypothetical protein n=1 Tax=Bradyrhizobium sp. URHD0069 TaxID=1380355 RepID=UPI000A6E3DEB|nr:hypothetical protein [Bradyrhizobium sp. URHD0069]
MKKKKIVLAGVALAALLGGSAMAADLSTAPMYKAPPAVAVWSWTGFYIGINGGYGFGNNDFTQSLTQPGIVASSFDKHTVAPEGRIVRRSGRLQLAGRKCCPWRGG